MQFNAVLFNFYHDVNDPVLWHSDKEVERKKNFCDICKLGQVRNFDIRNKAGTENIPLCLKMVFSFNESSLTRTLGTSNSEINKGMKEN